MEDIRQKNATLNRSHFSCSSFDYVNVLRERERRMKVKRDI